MSNIIIKPQMLIPEVVSQYPSTREVFDKYGLKGCGGPEGPKETVEFFARAHAVELNKLLEELSAAARQDVISPGASDYRYEESLADVLYKKFFKGGIAVALTVGCFFGALILLYYGLKQSFFSVPINLVHLHGHAQVFGWIGLIAMGFAYQAYPRFKFTTLAYPELANRSFLLMVVGLVIRSVAQAFLHGQSLIFLGVVSGALELVAVSLFLVIMVKTVRQSERGIEFYDKFIFTALVSFWLVALFNPVLFYLVNTAPSEQVLINRIATWFLPYRDLQLLAFATMLIFGVSQRFIPAVLGFKEASKALSTTIYVLFSVAIVTDIVFYLLLRTSFLPVWGTGLQISFLLMLLSAILMVQQLGIFHKPADWDRSLKFIQAAYAWLIVAFVLLTLFPLYNRLTGQAFSHAFFGAYRHAITVGFISMMILGVSSKVIPVLSGLDPQSLNPLKQAFYLLNIGNIIRVGSQIATEHYEWAYAIMGISGFIEVAALGFWGVDIWRAIDARPMLSKMTVTGEITASMKVAEVLDLYPETTEVFLRYGFNDIKNPVLRRTMAKAATLKMACGIHNVDLDEFVSALNERVNQV